MRYTIVIVPLSEEDGGGFYGIVPDLKGCISDGSTPEEALKSTQAAIDEWIDAAHERGMTIPAPGSAAVRQHAEQAKFVAELRSLAEGVENFEARLQLMEEVITDLAERLDHADAWDRFAKLTGVTGAGTVRAVSMTRLLPNG